MKKYISLFVATVMFCCSSLCFAQEVLKPKIVEKLQQNVFEVVVEKIQDDPLTYEKELPLDRIPYHIRMDKYESIGTAFLLTDGHFYTAAHVLNLSKKSQLNKYSIRTADGTTYKIGNVVKFSTDRDFVIFDVIDFNKGKLKGLETDVNYKMNSTVFAVGNAQGEGIVMRNGLLTSSTPETKNGEWNWLRFSAAASPGNSGGPLVTPQGKVIGIVAMKNSSENLNYALPVSEMDKVAENTGVLNQQFYYNLPNILNDKFHHELNEVIELPKSLDEVRNECYEVYKNHTEKLVAELTADYKFTGSKNFAKDDLKNDLLNSKYNPGFPNLICLNEKGKWSTYKPQNISTLKLDNNGKIEAGSMLGLIMSYLTKPDTITVQEYIENPKLLMDTLSKIFVMSRNIGSEKINITSYGEPVFTYRYEDNLGRVWIVSGFHVPFADYGVLNFALPLPDGIFSLTAMMNTNHIYNGVNYDFEFISDFILSSYYGTTKNWQEYLSIPEEVYPRHKILKGAALVMDEKEVKFEFDPFFITCPEETFKIDEKTEIELGVGYRPDETYGLKQQFQVLNVVTLQNTNDEAELYMSRDYKPNEDSSKYILDKYKEIESKTIPYNGVPYEQDQQTAIFIPEIGEEYISLFGLVNKGSKMETIKADADILWSSIK